MRLLTFALVLLFSFDALAAQVLHNRSMRENGGRREGILLTGCEDDVVAGAPCDDTAQTDIVLDNDWSGYVYCGDKANLSVRLRQSAEDAGAALTVNIWSCERAQSGADFSTTDPSLVAADDNPKDEPVCVNLSTEFGGGAMDASAAANQVDQLSVSNFAMGYIAAEILCAGGVGCEGFVLEYACWGPTVE